jgi:hypothetical protein
MALFTEDLRTEGLEAANRRNGGIKDVETERDN